jgi:multidrug efflux pump subunit AcrA (membrane-fusion protein)
VAGRLLSRKVNEGSRVDKDTVLAVLDTADTELALLRARAERAGADAQLRLLKAGSRNEDIRQAEAQTASARADVLAAEADVTAAEADVQRFEMLLASNSGRANSATTRLRGGMWPGSAWSLPANASARPTSR